MRKRRFLSALVIAFLLCAAALAQTAAPPDLDAWVERSMKTFNVPGLAIAIVKDGKLVVSKGYGVKRLGSPDKVDDHTLFPIGSNTKAFTSAALATLVDEGKISWDDHVEDLLPGFRLYDPYITRELTVRDLLTHRAGFSLGAGDLLFWPHTTFTSEEIVHRLRYIKPATSFRSHYAYDNTMYLVAGQIIPAITGKSWDAYVHERILQPLGMTNTNTSVTAFKPGDDFATGHSEVDGKLQPIDWVPIDNNAPAGAINSSVFEMAKWAVMQLNRGKIDDQHRIFSEKQSREMWSPQTITPVGDPPPELAAIKANFADYALGWGLRDYHGRKLVGHTGGVLGAVSKVQLVPEDNLAIIILTNAEETFAFESIAYSVMDYYMKAPATDWITAFKTIRDAIRSRGEEAEKKLRAEQDKNSRPSLALEKYAGTYEDAWYGPMTIRLENGHLVLSMDHTPGLVGDLEHWQYETFKTHWRDRSNSSAEAFVTFALNPNGSIDEIKMVPVSPLTDFSYDYQDLLFKPAKK